MRLENLHLLNFKNYEEVNLSFPSRINILVGKNGSGKTNLLDAIFYLSFTKSAFSQSDLQLVRHEQPFFLVKGEFQLDGTGHTISSSLQVGAKKIFREDTVDYQKVSDHIGKYPVIFMAPDDVDLIREGGELRRKFFDAIISQLDHTYLEALMRYNHFLKQRNSLLKMFFDRGAVDWLAIESYDQELASSGIYIYEKRRQFTEEFVPAFQENYQFIVQQNESTGLKYDSELHHKNFLEGFQESRNKDLVLQRTSFGIHRDDFVFTIAGRDIKRLGSQGQQKSFAVSLKLAQYEILKKYKGFEPVLLLDDIFDKLDDSRISKLLEIIKSRQAQLFITDARPDRTRKLLDEVAAQSAMFYIENGKVTGHGRV